MGGAKAVIAAGIGCRRNCPAEPIVALVRLAGERAGCVPSCLAVPSFRAEAPAVRDAATRLGLPLVAVDRAALTAVQADCPTRSPRAERETGLASVAEAAALATAGPGATLILPRIGNASATCALAARSDG